MVSSHTISARQPDSFSCFHISPSESRHVGEVFAIDLDGTPKTENEKEVDGCDDEAPGIRYSGRHSVCTNSLVERSLADTIKGITLGCEVWFRSGDDQKCDEEQKYPKKTARSSVN